LEGRSVSGDQFRAASIHAVFAWLAFLSIDPNRGEPSVAWVDGRTDDRTALALVAIAGGLADHVAETTG
jgi:hypothetical protein